MASKSKCIFFDQDLQKVRSEKLYLKEAVQGGIAEVNMLRSTLSATPEQWPSHNRDTYLPMHKP